MARIVHVKFARADVWLTIAGWMWLAYALGVLTLLARVAA